MEVDLLAILKAKNRRALLCLGKYGVDIITLYSYWIIICGISWSFWYKQSCYRNIEAKSRPQFGQITQLLASNHNYLLGWSDEDKKCGGEDAMKLGGRLESTKSLYDDLQLLYARMECANYLSNQQ